MLLLYIILAQAKHYRHYSINTHKKGNALHKKTGGAPCKHVKSTSPRNLRWNYIAETPQAIAKAAFILQKKIAGNTQRRSASYKDFPKLFKLPCCQAVGLFGILTRMKTLLLCTFACIIILLFTGAVMPPLALQTEAAIMVEQTTGRVLYERNMHRRMYPASMTKLLTALVVLDYLHPDDVLVIGSEIRNMPLGYATGILQEGESVSVHVLLKSLLIRSANESARVLALHTVQVRNNRFNLNYMEDAKSAFAAMLNDKARELGAMDTRFTNPYGLHDTRHFTTAYDLALIARTFMDIPLLADIVAMPSFTGSGVYGQIPPEGALVRDFHWINTNQMLPDGPFGHPFVTGMRTGYTTPAGECLAASAYHNGLGLITIVFDSASPGRWNDTRRMLDFGFANFAFREKHAQGDIAIPLYNPRLEDDGYFMASFQGSHRALLSIAEFDTLEEVITYDPLLLIPAGEGENPVDYPRMRIPYGGIEAGAVVGTVSYKIEGEIWFTLNLYASHDVLERTFDSDMDFFIARWMGAIFSRQAVPYWFGSIGTLFGILGISIAVTVSRRARNYGRWRSMPRGRF